MPEVFTRRFSVLAPSTSATTMSPTCGSCVRLTITRSPSKIPAPSMLSPVTRRTNDVLALLNSS